MKIPAAKLHFSNKTAKELSKKDYDEHEKDLTQRRRGRRVLTENLFRTRIYRIPRIDDERLLTPPLAALTPPLRWEGS